MGELVTVCCLGGFAVSSERINKELLVTGRVRAMLERWSNDGRIGGVQGRRRVTLLLVRGAGAGAGCGGQTLREGNVGRTFNEAKEGREDVEGGSDGCRERE